ncbi:MAG: hypothetical protein IJ667_06890 [Synergistaceae bacterium]|nr:hypothetical protein [Synergistaceae bacterium]
MIALLLDGVKQVDLALQDPPYGMKCQKKDGAVGDSKQIKNLGAVLCGKCDNVLVAAKTCHPIAGDDSSDTARLNYEIIKHLSRVQIIWGRRYLAHFLPVNGGWIVWDRLLPGNDFSDRDGAWKSKGRTVKKYHHKFREGSQKLNLKRSVHTTQKPVELLVSIIVKALEKCEELPHQDF